MSTLILFARYPRPGFVKTRLAKTVGVDAATRWYQTNLSQLLDTAASLPPDIVPTIHYSELTDAVQMQDFVAGRCVLYPQSGDTLPQRIQHAFTHEFDMRRVPTMILSTDVPDLTREEICFARTQLQTYDVVIGTDSDGGYYMLGLRSPHLQVLDITYGAGEGTYAQTIRNAKSTGLTVYELPQKIDVDTIEDLRSWVQMSTQHSALVDYSKKLLAV